MTKKVIIDPERWAYPDGCYDKDDKCRKCNLKRLADGCDPCIGRLPGVISACCGHGSHAGYVGFENGVTVLLVPGCVHQLNPEEIATAKREGEEWAHA